MPRLNIATAAVLLLTGCVAATSSPGGLPGWTSCPHLEAYTDAERDRAAGEIETLLPADSMVARMVDDYGALRAAIRPNCSPTAESVGSPAK